MSDTIDTYNAMKEGRKLLRAKYGLPCIQCVTRLPKANPSILLPQQRCRIHGYVDPRPELTQADYDETFAS